MRVTRRKLPAMARDDLNRVLAIRNDRLHRLRLLERRQAVEGIDTPPSVIIEIEQARRELGIADSVVKNPGSMEMAEAVGSAGQYLALDSKLDTVVKYLSERMDRMEENSVVWRELQAVERRFGKRERRVIELLLFVGVAIAILLAVLH